MSRSFLADNFTMEQVASSECAKPEAPGGIPLPIPTMPSLNWTEPDFRSDLSKTDKQAPFQLKYRLLQRNRNSLSLPSPHPPSPKSKRAERFCSMVTAQGLACTEGKLRSAPRSSGGLRTRGPAWTGPAARPRQDRFHRQTASAGPLQETHICVPAIWCTRSSWTSNKSLLQGLNFKLTALTFFIPKFIPIKSL